jgi:hypothetical protein
MGSKERIQDSEFLTITTSRGSNLPRVSITRVRDAVGTEQKRGHYRAHVSSPPPLHPVHTARKQKTQSTPLTLLTGQSGRPTTPHCRHSPSPASRPRPPSSLSDGGGREGRFRGALPSPHPQPPPPPAGTPDPASSPSPPLSHLPHFA